MTKFESAREAALRIRLAVNARAPASPDDADAVVGFLVEVENAVLGAVDLLAQSRNAFRSKQVERARKMLEEIL